MQTALQVCWRTRFSAASVGLSSFEVLPLYGNCRKQNISESTDKLYLWQSLPTDPGDDSILKETVCGEVFEPSGVEDSYDKVVLRTKPHAI